ncbi:MAG: YggU family protein [Deltaproteobacteria bacterium]|nr:YggU family protein [Deltaproteobacteria bacterium]
MLSIRENPQGILFKVYVQPRSSKNMIVGLHADSLKIKVTAAPVDGAANKSCVKFLAKCLSVAPSALEIVSGHHGRMKTLLLKSQKTPPSVADYTHLKKRIDRLMNSTV